MRSLHPVAAALMVASSFAHDLVAADDADVRLAQIVTVETALTVPPLGGRVAVPLPARTGPGTLFVWADSDRIDPVLFGRRGDDTIEDDDTGGGTTPFLRLVLEDGDEVEVAVAGKGKSHSEGLVRAHAVFAPSTGESLRVAERSRVERLQMERSGHSDRQVAKELAEELLSVLDSTPCGEVHLELSLLCNHLVALGLLDLVKQSNQRIHAFRRCTHPASHRRAVLAVMQIAAVAMAEGRYRDAAEWFGRADEACCERSRDEVLLKRTARSYHAGMLSEIGQYNEAITIYESVLAADDADGLEEPLADWRNRRSNYAVLLVATGLRDEAARIYEGLIDRADAMGQGVEAATFRIDLARTLEGPHNADRSERLVQSVIDTLRGAVAETDPLMIRARLTLASRVATRRTYESRRAALELRRQLVADLEAALEDDDRKLVEPRIVLAQSLRLSGEKTEATRILIEVERRARAAGDRATLVSALAELVHSCESGALERAEEHLGLVRDTRSEGHVDIAEAEQLVALVLAREGHLDESARLLADAVAKLIRVLGPDGEIVLGAQASLAEIHALMGRDHEALGIVQDALGRGLRQFAPTHEIVVTLRRVLAEVLEHLGDDALALEIRRDAYVILARELPDDDDFRQVAAFLLANSLGRFGQHAEALALLVPCAEVLDRHRPLSDPVRTNVRLKIIDGLLALGRQQEASEEVDRVKGMRDAGVLPPEVEISILERFAAVEEANGRLDAAWRLRTEIHRRYVEQFGLDSLYVEGTTRSLGWVALRMNKPEVAVENVLAMVHATRDRLCRVAMTESPRVAEARARGEGGAISLGFSLFPDMAPEERDDVFSYAEETRGLAIAAARLERRLAGSHDTRLVVGRNQIRAAASEVTESARAGRPVADAALRRDAATRQLRALLGDAQLPRVTSQSVASTITSSEAVVVYRAFANFSSARHGDPGPYPLHLHVVVIRPDRGAESYDLGLLDPVEALARRWVDEMLDFGGSQRAARSIGQELRRLILDPIEADLEGADRIFVVPDGPLQTIPIDALPDGRRVVGDRRLWTRLPCLSVLFEPARELLASPRLVAVGDVDFGPAAPGQRSASFPALPRSKPELDLVVSRFSKRFDLADPWLQLSGDRATKASLAEVAPTATFLHLATHGYSDAPSPVDPDQPVVKIADWIGYDDGFDSVLAPRSRTGLALAGANSGDEGLLSSEEISAFDLSECRLAVVSACEGTIGPQWSGHALHSIETALHTAGVDVVVTCLWKVDDAATCEMMECFYDELWSYGRSPAEALWAAKCRFRDERRPAWSWAGWVISGR